MQIENSFTIPLSVDEAWPLLLDVARVAPCVPGAVVDAVQGDEFAGHIKVKLGPIQLTYAGTGRFLERDEKARRAVIEGVGRDARGASTATATITTVLVERAGETEVQIATHLVITGKPAQFGRGVLQEVSTKLVGQFATNLAAQLTLDGPTVDAPAPALSSAPTSPQAAPTIPEPEPLDLMGVAAPAVAKRVLAAVLIAAVLAVVVRRLVGRSRAG